MLELRGINAMEKCDAVWDMIEKSACSVFCFQETKREHFEMSFFRKFVPRRFDRFDYIPSVGASGGSLCFGIASSFEV